MSHNKTKIDCLLVARGTSEVDSNVMDDMSISDPELAVGKELIHKAMKEGTENDG